MTHNTVIARQQIALTFDSAMNFKWLLCVFLTIINVDLSETIVEMQHHPSLNRIHVTSSCILFVSLKYACLSLRCQSNR